MGMDADKLTNLEAKLYNDTPLLGEMIRLQAAKELAQKRTPASLKLLAKALTFSKDKKVQNIILSTLRKIRLDDRECIDAICEVWAENRNLELAKFLKLKGWIASKPIQVKILTALKTGHKDIIKGENASIIKLLLQCLQDEDSEIAQRAREWLLSLKNSELQEELCRLASEENHQLALEIANEAAYVSSDPQQAALFYFLTEQWEEYQQVDPQQKLLAQIYDSASQALKQRIDEKGETGKRIEWVWLVIGGQEGERLAQLNKLEWQKILDILTSGKYWQEMWQLALIAPAFWSRTMLKTLQMNRWKSPEPQERGLFTNLVQLGKKCKTKEVPQETLIRHTHTLTGHNQGIESAIISRDGKLLISAGGDLIRVWQLDRGELLTTLEGHTNSVTSLCLSDNGVLLASGSRDRTICLWNLPKGNLLSNLLVHQSSVWCLGMTSDSKLLVSGSYKTATLWLYPPGKFFNALRGHKREVECLAISSDDKLLVTGGGYLDNTVRLWKLPKGEQLKTLEGHTDAISCLAISPDNTLLASGSKDNTLRLWQLPDGEAIATLSGHEGKIRCVAISSDGTLLATGSDDHTVKLWQLPEGKLITTLAGHTDAVWCLVISADGQLLATGGKDQTIKLWRLPEGKELATLTGHQGAVRCMVMTPDGQTLVSGSNDHTLRLWRWELPRLCHLPVNSLSDSERQWIEEALTNDEIAEVERNWLAFLHQLTQLQTKVEDRASIDAFCQDWAQKRDPALTKLLKSKKWIASKPIELRVLTALNLDRKDAIEATDTSIVMPLLAACQDRDPEIAQRAKQWLLSLRNSELQQEICRLASEENHQLAIEVAREAGFAPADSQQAALFYFFTEQWQKYQQIDPQQKLLAQIYDSAPEQLKQRIDDRGKIGKRIEWVWLVIGGHEGRRLAQINDADWQKILDILVSGKYWQEMWSLTLMAPLLWTRVILKILLMNKWLPEDPQQRNIFTNLVQLAKNCKTKEVPRETLLLCVKTITGHTRGIESMVVTPDGKLLISAGDDLIRVWQLDNGELLTTLQRHAHSVSSLCLSKDGALLASGSRDKTVCLWRLPEGDLLHQFSGHTASVWCLGMTGNGKILASGSYQEARIWQYPPGNLIHNLRGHKREIDCLTISSDDRLLVTGGGYLDNTIRLWELPQGRPLKTLIEHSDAISCLAISPDNTLLASGSKDCTVRLWKLPEGKAIATLAGHTARIWCLAISPDGTLLATGSDDHTVKLWQLPQGKLITTLEGHTDAVWCLAISDDGRLLTSGSKDSTFKLWRLPDGKYLKTLTEHQGAVKCMAITSNRQMLVSGSSDQTLRLWKWELPRLCSLPLNSLSDSERLWIQEALTNIDITEQEGNWLRFLNQLAQLKLTIN